MLGLEENAGCLGRRGADICLDLLIFAAPLQPDHGGAVAATRTWSFFGVPASAFDLTRRRSRVAGALLRLASLAPDGTRRGEDVDK